MKVAMFILFVVLFALGACVFVRGLRGKRVGTKLHCGRCNFSLEGHAALATLLLSGPEASASEDSQTSLASGTRSDTTNRATCSECGANLHTPDGVRMGQWRRNPGLVVAGLVLAISGVFGTYRTAVGPLGAARFVAASLSVKGLQTQLSVAPATLVDDAASELRTRLAASKLTAAEIDETINTLLLVRADASKPWPPSCSTLLRELIATAGPPTPAQQVLYARGGVATPRVEFRSRVREGQRLPTRISLKAYRPIDAFQQLMFRTVVAELRVDGKLISNVQPPGYSSSSVANLQPIETFEVPPIHLNTPLSVGKHTLSGVVQVIVIDQNDNELAKVPHSFEATVEALRADEPSVVVRDIPLEEMFGKDKAPMLECTWHAIRNVSGRSTFSWSARTPSLPVGFAGTAKAMWLDPLTKEPQEADFGSFVFQPAQDIRSYVFYLGQSTSIDQRLSSVDLTLEFDSRVAESQIDMTECWGGTIVVKDVPIFTSNSNVPSQRKLRGGPLAQPSQSSAHGLVEGLVQAKIDQLQQRADRQVMHAPDAPQDEITLAIQRREVSREQLAPLIDSLLRHQADTKFQWSLRDGDTLDAAIAENLLSQEEQVRYYTQAFHQGRITLPRRAWEGEPFQVFLSNSLYRLGSQTPITTQLTTKRVRVANRDFEFSETTGLRYLPTWETWQRNFPLSVASFTRPISIKTQLATGSSSVNIMAEVEVWKGDATSFDARSRPQPLLVIPMRYEATIRALKQGDQGLKIIEDDGYGELLRSALRREECELWTMSVPLSAADGQISYMEMCGAKLVFGPLAYEYCFDLLARSTSPHENGKAAGTNHDLLVGTFSRSKGEGNWEALSFVQFIGVQPTWVTRGASQDALPTWFTPGSRVRLLLRSNVKHASRSTSLNEVWDGPEIDLGEFEIARGTYSGAPVQRK